MGLHINHSALGNDLDSTIMDRNDILAVNIRMSMKVHRHSHQKSKENYKRDQGTNNYKLIYRKNRLVESLEKTS